MARILLVEDNEMNRDMLQRRLQRRGHCISVAMDGAESVEKAKAELPDLILMDISLPVMDGYEATRILKANASTRGIPILGLSAHAMSGDAEKALQAGCDDYDTKPVDLRRLLRKVEDLLQRKGAAPESPLADSASPPSEPSVVATGEGSAARNPASPAVSQPATPPPTRDSAHTPPPVAAAGRQGAWVVIGDEGLRADVLRQLAEIGVTACCSLNSDEILAATARGQVEALLLDHRTSDIDAEPLIRQARRLSGDELRILVVSSVDALQSAFRCLEAGADFFLPAPFTNHLLHTRLRGERPGSA